MPRPGGESDKLGNQFEAVWTVDAVIDVFVGAFKSITVEAFGDESQGVEFHLENIDGSLQFHSVKRQKQGGDWSIADLCREDKATGRSVVGDLFEKRRDYPDAETRFVSSTGANELRELSERADLCLRMDSFELCNTARQLGEQLDLPASPAVVLASLAGDSSSVLVVDQLDAMSLVSGRNPRMWQVFQDLCDEVRSYPRMKMILACRDFDLNHDHRLRSLADSQSGFTKYTLDRLGEADIQASLAAAGFGQLKPNERQLEILGVPFHLLLLLQGDPTRSFTSVGELYDRYWNRKRQNLRERLGRDPHWNEVIDALTQKMSEQQALFAPKLVTENWQDDAQAMTSEHVLVEMQSQRQYRFFHESFFDYAYARRFCASGRGVVEFLESTEQHLFRRAQVRQILAYRRENDFEQYIADLREVLESPNIRFHIKRMVASGLSRIDEPAAEEWAVAEPHVLNGELSRYVSPALRDHTGWFDLLDSLKVFENWLSSADARLNNAATWYLQSNDLHDRRSSRIAELIAPYVNRDDDDWKQRIRRIMSWGKAYKSGQMEAIYLGLIERGFYDDDRRQSPGGDFWSQHYNAEKEAPRFLIDVLATWFDRAIALCDDGESTNVLDKHHQNKSRTGAGLVGKAATAEPDYFVEEMLPRAAKAILRTEVRQGGEVRNRVWPYLSNRGDPFEIDDAILLYLRRALQHLATHNPAALRKHAATIYEHPHQTFGYLLLRAWADNPNEFADDCAAYLVVDQRRFNIGYSLMSGGSEGTGESAISRIALRDISPHCSAELFEQLEARIIGYCNEYEKSMPRWRGYAELLVLRSLDKSRISQKTALRIEELERKFPDLTDEIVEEDKSVLLKAVGSPISRDTANFMTDDQWISAMKKYDGTTDRFRGGPVELSRSLSEFARKDRDRFASLIARMPDDLDPMYFSAILDGLCGRWTNLSKEEKEADQRIIEATSTNTLLNVIDRLHSLPDRPCGSAIAGCIRTLSNRPLPSRVLDVVSHYATSDPDPDPESWRRYEGGKEDLHQHGINCVRGQAAEAISSLLYDDQTRLGTLRPALVALSTDPVDSVRTCAIVAFLPLLNFERDLAIELFLEACGRSEDICATQPFDHFVHYAVYTHYEQLRELLYYALNSNNTDAVENAARQTILAELGDVDVGYDAANIRTGSETMRKAAAGVYATNLAHDVVGDKCAERLEEFFNDEAESVRAEVTSAFFDMSGERLLHLKDFIAQFIESPCFENETDRLLHALEESNVELPQILCRAAERILEFLGEEGTNIAYHGSMVAHGISTLVVRQYEQTTDDATKTHCLDLIDRMERVGYLGIGDELSKIDR